MRKFSHERGITVSQPARAAGFAGVLLLCSGLAMPSVHAQEAGQASAQEKFHCVVSKDSCIILMPRDLTSARGIFLGVSRVDRRGITLNYSDAYGLGTHEIGLECGKASDFWIEGKSLSFKAISVGEDRADVTVVVRRRAAGPSSGRSAYDMRCFDAVTFTNVVREGSPLLGPDDLKEFPEMTNMRVSKITDGGIDLSFGGYAQGEDSMPWSIPFGRKAVLGEYIFTIKILAEKGSAPGTAKVTVTMPGIRDSAESVQTRKKQSAGHETESHNPAEPFQTSGPVQK